MIEPARLPLDRSSTDAEIRAQVARWVGEHVPQAWQDAAARGGRAAIRSVRSRAEYDTWYPRFAASGLAVATWPVAYGGLDLAPAQAAIGEAVLSPYNLGRLNPLGLNSAAPALFAFGTEEQRLRFLPPLVRNEEKWCQLLSEPGAGSDLASLATRAVRDGDEWIVSGQKVWTTWAHVSDYAVCLARTDPTAPKRRGLTYFLVDLHAAGVDVRPLRHIGGEVDFNEVFLDAVRVPDAHRVGAVGEGWRVAGATLAGERQMVSGAGSGGVDRIGGSGIDHVIARAQELGAASDPHVRNRLAGLVAEERMRGWTNQRVRAAVRAGSTPGPAASIGKVHQGGLNQRMQMLAADVLGPDAAAWMPPADGAETGPEAWAEAMPFEVKGMLRSRANTIEGGTTEVNKNILGEKVLGLPREPDPYIDAPWEDVPRFVTVSLAGLLVEHPFADDEPLLHTRTETLTAGAARAEAEAIAARLRSAGVQPGHAVALQLANGPHLVTAMFGVWLAGAVLVPVNPRAPEPEVARVLDRDPRPKVLVRDALEVLDDPRHYAADTAFVTWTSGTTGPPKPILHTHSAYVELLDRVLGPLRGTPRAPGADAKPPSPNLIPVSLALNAGIYNVLFGLRAGAAIVVMDGFDTAGFAELVSRFAIRSTVLPPAAITMLADDAAVTDLAPLRFVRSITAPLSPLQARRFIDKFGVVVLNSYGQAEIGEVIGWTAADAREHPEKLGALGRAHPGVGVKIVADDGTPVAAGGTGRLVVRPPSMAAGDVNGDGLADRIDADGYLDTGDIARVDADGFVWIEGRAGDVINRGGNKVFPDQVEEVLRLAPGVSDAAVVGVADDRLGEVPIAFVVAAAPVTDAVLTAVCREHLAPYKVPVAFHRVDALPRSEVGKVLRRELGRTGAHMSRYETLLVERRGSVGWLEFNRPSVANAMNSVMLAELERRVRIELDDDPDVRVIVNTGAGTAFQTGLDVVELSRNPDALREQSRRTKRAELRLSAWHNQVWKPVIAAVNGVCAGGGLHFVADADIVIASATLTFLDPHVSIGQVTAYEAIALVRKSPMEAIMRMALTGRYERITATRAYELGILSQVVDPPDQLRAEAQTLAEKIAKNSPAAMRATKKALWGALEMGLTDACRAGGQELVSMWGHPDQAEGPSAFVERREPNWQPLAPEAPEG